MTQQKEKKSTLRLHVPTRPFSLAPYGSDERNRATSSTHAGMHIQAKTQQTYMTSGSMGLRAHTSFVNCSHSCMTSQG